MLSSWLGYACYFATDKNPSFAWRFPLCVQTLPPLVLLITSIWIPRSPRWLLQKGKIEEAWRVIQALRRSPDDPDDLAAREELYQTKEQIALDAAKLKATGYSPLMACFKQKSYRKRMIIGFLTQWGAEFAGPLVIVCTHARYYVVKSTADSDRTTTRSSCTPIWARRVPCLFCCPPSGSRLRVRLYVL
jgi:hypothetical protein